MKRSTEISKVGEIEDVAAQWVARRDAGLSPSDERELQRWIDADPRHGAALGFYDSAWSALGKPSQSGVGAELEQQLATLAGRRRQRRITVGGAVMVVLLAIGFASWNSPRRAIESTSPSAVVLVPARQTLPDGSVVELKGNAQISVDFGASIRRVMLKQGEAHFEVQKDSARPFVVTAGGVEVRAVGTAFAVQLRSSAVEVLVTHGSVAVDKSAAPLPPDGSLAVAPLASVDAGKRVVVEIAPSDVVPEVSVVPPAELRERLAWRNLRLEFTRTPLAEAVALLNRHAPPSAVQFLIADSNVAAMRVSGVFRPDNADAFVLLLEGAFHVKAERSGNTITLRNAH
jgi:transmembrane sensor